MRIGIGLLAAAWLLNACVEVTTPEHPEVTTLEAVDPAAGAISVAAGATVVLTFSHAMLHPAAMAVELHEGPLTAAVVEGVWTWSEDRIRLSFTPAQPLKRAQLYTIHVGGGLLDARGHVVDMERHGQHLGGEWATAGMMGQGPGPMNGGSTHMGAGWMHANGAYGMIFTFTTAG